MTDYLNDRTVLLTGATGGIGRALVDALLASGVREVIGASTRPLPATAGVRPEQVDVTDLASVRALGARLATSEVSLVIHCAGTNANAPLFTEDFEAAAQREMAVNYFGLLHLASAFAPLLSGREGARLVSMLSFVSHVAVPEMASYCASKAAAHSLTESLRNTLAERGVAVSAIYPMAVDTAMSSHLPGDKMAPDLLAREVVEALQRGDERLYPGPAAAAHVQLVRAHALAVLSQT